MNTTPITNSPGKVIGGGEIGSNNGEVKAAFCFTVPYVKGECETEESLIYQDYENNLRLRATCIDLLVVERNHAWFTGNGRLDNGETVRFTVEIYIAPDTFHIYIPSLCGYEAGGPVSEGAVTIYT